MMMQPGFLEHLTKIIIIIIIIIIKKKKILQKKTKHSEIAENSEPLSCMAKEEKKPK